MDEELDGFFSRWKDLDGKEMVSLITYQVFIFTFRLLQFIVLSLFVGLQLLHVMTFIFSDGQLFCQILQFHEVIIDDAEFSL